ncbi:ATPase synthesis protein 25, mitochondrial [Cyphellophora attinorum]|uniref:ATPase synthesis protein 25 n=1 Tax=Cyphellophora attinorum TaxID=1664694 RepID=A0A0N0NL62_9EURO|nr:ATPase synthesis protein 25, mitochondrial [Phialophora attinorum]KPI38931.1 ATPase synthesis protein 25, mitochondrial [Phialophora attinorum]
MARPFLRCNACWHTLLDAFASFAGISLRAPVRRTLPTRTSYRTSIPITRQLHNSIRRHQNTEAQHSTPPDERTSPETTDTAPAPEPPSSGTSDPVPWYLNLPDPLPPLPPTTSLLSPLLARQTLPPLPNSPPPILSPMLSHLSIAIGLDNLSVLDLRSLNPPPALGANLIMIIGTARSVKHLNVSADRFCRWLRSEYKLRPYADGLLGRNELKIRLRRKARRMRLARTAGRLDAEDSPAGGDGITTGWVCVNVGDVSDVVVPAVGQSDAASEAATDPANDTEDSFRERSETVEEEEEEYQNPTEDEISTTKNPTSFGLNTLSPTSARIVVQMFTEDKRVEMDLETLYTNRESKMQKHEDRADKDIAREQAERGVGSDAEEIDWFEDEDEQVAEKLARQQQQQPQTSKEKQPSWNPLFS